MKTGAVDFAYLEDFAAEDKTVIAEVLTIFLTEAIGWRSRLDGPGWKDAVHTIKGAGRSVGAKLLSEVCERTEAIGAEMIPDVREALAAAVGEIEAYLAGSSPA